MSTGFAAFQEELCTLRWLGASRRLTATPREPIAPEYRGAAIEPPSGFNVSQEAGLDRIERC